MATPAPDRPPVAIVGAGTMGAGLARLLAGAGHLVRVTDARPQAAERVAATTARVSAHATVEEAVSGTELAIEAVLEELEAKRAVMAAMAAAPVPPVVMATNTSALSVSEIAEAVPEPLRARVVGAHFFNPPDVVPAVEVVRGPASGAAAIARTVELLEAAGKAPAVVRDTPGFVANRIQHAMVIEAWRCLEEGVADAEAIDTIVSASFGFRLFAYGPFRIGDLNGLDVYRAVHEQLEQAYGERFAPPRALVELVQRGALGVKAGHGAYEYEPGEAQALLARRDALLRTLAAVRAREVGEG